MSECELSGREGTGGDGRREAEEEEEEEGGYRTKNKNPTSMWGTERSLYKQFVDEMFAQLAKPYTTVSKQTVFIPMTLSSTTSPDASPCLTDWT